MPDQLSDYRAEQAPEPVVLDAAQTVKYLLAGFRASLDAMPSTQRYTSETLATVYGVAHAHLQVGQCANALPLLVFVTHYAPTHTDYGLALGICLQRLARYDDALRVFAWRMALGDPTYEATVWSAECLLAVRSHSAARQLLQLVIHADMEARTQGSPAPAEPDIEGRTAAMVARALALLQLDGMAGRADG